MEVLRLEEGEADRDAFVGAEHPAGGLPVVVGLLADGGRDAEGGAGLDLRGGLAGRGPGRRDAREGEDAEEHGF